MATNRIDRNHPAGANARERFSTHHGNLDNGYPSYFVAEDAKPSGPTRVLPYGAQMPTPRNALDPAPSLLNEGLSRPAFNGNRVRR